MHSSERKLRLKSLTKPLWVWISIAVAACAVVPAPSQSAAQPVALVPCTVTDGTAAPQDTATMLALRRNVEGGPLFTVPAAAGVASCVARQDSAAIELEYRFKNGGWLHVKRDARIEYTEQEARFVLPAGKDPVNILADAERAAFGPNGCGIDWQQAETQTPTDDPSTTETVFRGAVCNCQARIRRDAAGRIVGLLLRSTC